MFGKMVMSVEVRTVRFRSIESFCIVESNKFSLRITFALDLSNDAFLAIYR